MVWPLRRISAFKFSETTASILESYLQLYLLFKKTEGIENIVAYLKKDIVLHGVYGSRLCSLLLSEFSVSYFFVNRNMIEIVINGSFTLLPTFTLTFLTVVKLAIVQFCFQFTRIVVFILCMNKQNSLLFIFLLFLLHLCVNKFWYGNNNLAINGALFTMKGLYPTEDIKSKRTVHRSLFYAVMEVGLFWILLGVTNLFGYFNDQPTSLLVLVSCLLLLNPIGVLVQLYAVKNNNFFAVCACGDVDMLSKMLHWPEINFNGMDQYHRTGFITACQYGQVEVVEFFLRNARWKQIDLNWQAENKLSGFHIACIRGHYKIVSLIMQHAYELSINLFLKDSEGQTAFEMWPEIFTETESEIHLKRS